MIAASIPMPLRKAVIWLMVAAGVALVIGANAHLVYVAVTSQPDCVAHLKAGEGEPAKTYSAAKSACSPPRNTGGDRKAGQAGS